MSALSVFIPRRFGRLLTSDAMNISRDPMLIFASLLSLAPAIGFWFGRAPLNAAAVAAFGIADLSIYIAPVALLLPAVLIGWVSGFLLLEDRDDGSLLAIEVTPVGKLGFLLYRLGIAALVTTAITLGAVQAIVPDLGLWRKILLIVLVAAAAVLAAAALPAIARNKVEGLALTKLINIAAVVPLLAAIPSPWRYLAGVVPTYWVGEIVPLPTAGALGLPLVALLALASHIGCGLAILRLLGRRAG